MSSIRVRVKGITNILDALEVVDENLVLGTIDKSVHWRVNRSALAVGWIKHVVSLVVGPVHWLLGLVADSGGVAPFRIQITRGLSITPNSRNGFSNNAFGGVGHVALERGHVHLVCSAVRVVYPEPSTDALSVGAGRKVGHIESLESTSRAAFNSGKHDEILGLDIIDV